MSRVAWASVCVRTSLDVRACSARRETQQAGRPRYPEARRSPEACRFCSASVWFVSEVGIKPPVPNREGQQASRPKADRYFSKPLTISSAYSNNRNETFQSWIKKSKIRLAQIRDRANLRPAFGNGCDTLYTVLGGTSALRSLSAAGGRTFFARKTRGKEGVARGAWHGDDVNAMSHTTHFRRL